MGNRGFLARLKKEMPEWVERGWVQAGADRAILEHVAARGGGTSLLTYAFSILGVLLLGSGIITYFAANWGEIPKIVKLAVLFGSMWLAYGAAWQALRGGHAPMLGQALLLFGAILFGANIMLIAQIYHIDAHFPNGVLLWSLGALVGAYAVRSQALLVAAIALGWLWTSLEFNHFWTRHHFHWPFLLLWLSCLPLIYIHRFRAALHLALVAMLWWSFYTISTGSLLWRPGNLVYLIQVYFLAYLAVFLLGMVFATNDRLEPFARIVQRYGIFATLAAGCVLTMPYLQVGHWSHAWAQKTERAVAGGGYLVATFTTLGVVLALALWHRARTGGAGRPAYLKWGEVLIGSIALLILVNLFTGGARGGLMAIAFNLLFFAGLLWLIFAGMHTDDRFLVNIAFVFFGVTLLMRYFDTFWTLLNRSYFFMVGGLLLIAGGYVLEHKRRQITAGIAGRREGGAK